MNLLIEKKIEIIGAIALQAGELLLSKRMNFEVNEKSPGEIVTPADLESNRFLVNELQKHYPDYGFSSEEGGEVGSQNKRFIIDPLDGTSKYVWGSSGYTISIAEEIDNKIVFGLVYDPEHHEMYFASPGKGAFRNNTPIHSSETIILSEALISCDWGNADDKRGEGLEYYRKLMIPIRKALRIVPQFSPANDLVRLAEGRIHALVCNDTWLEDLSAGALIAKEAGAIVTNFYNRTDFDHQKPGIIAACNQTIWNSLVQALEFD
jgi:myo-inositol-1(or 4)-monophosphatase